MASGGEGDLNIWLRKEIFQSCRKPRAVNPLFGKNVNRTADDAAKKAQKTEQKYEEKRGILQNSSFLPVLSLNAKRQ
jgi:hypothetical protein